MRIVFICGGIEPGKDGVGDYTRRLAGELIRGNHEAAVVALNDRFITEPVDCEQESEGAPIRVLRLPGRLPWTARIACARGWIDRYGPDWISLQFVIFGYHPKGLPLGLGHRLKILIGDRDTHIMFHELWLGCAKGGSWKNRLLGVVQRQIVRDLLQQVRPAVVQSHTALFIDELKHMGVAAQHLPLFGSIPPAREGDSRAAREILARHGPEWNPDSVIAGVFGTIYPEWDPHPMLGSLLDHLAKERRSLVLVAFGQGGAAAVSCLGEIRSRWGAQIRVIELGMQSERLISGLLSLLDLGLATSPWSIIGKSSTAAAFLDFGLPVLVTRNDVPASGEDEVYDDERLFRFEPEMPFGWTGALAKRASPHPRLPEIATQFAASLGQAHRNPLL